MQLLPLNLNPTAENLYLTAEDANPAVHGNLNEREEVQFE
jgi:hypothetical protein